MEVITLIKKGDVRGTVYRDVGAAAKVVGVSKSTIERRIGRGLIEVGEWFVFGCDYVKSGRGGKR
jgi:hypothetical protein